jgi:AcrR family transcriptional regulator
VAPYDLGVTPKSRRDIEPPVWARGDEESMRPALSREQVVRAAIDLADRDGLDAVSIRRIAAALDARPMSLYSYVPSKDDLFDLMFDELAGQALFGAELPVDWTAALRGIAHRVRDLGLAHPWSTELLSRRAHLGPNVIRLLEEWVAALDPLDLAPADAWRIVTAVNDYVNGYVIREAAQRRAVPSAPGQARRWQQQVTAYLNDLAASGDYPHIAPLLSAGYATADDNFDTGLDWLVDSVARRHQLPAARRGGRPRAR